MTTNDATRATAEGLPAETRDIGDAIDLLARAISLNELMFLAGEGIELRHIQEAITAGADVIDGVLKEVKTILYANIDAKGGAA